jgi:hypothetical protein
MRVKDKKQRKGLRNMRLGCIIMKNSGGGAHGMEGEGCRWHGEGTNGAAPPASSLLGLRPAVASGTPTLLLASIWGMVVLQGQKRHDGAYFWGLLTPKPLADFWLGTRFLR